ncbi:MAG: phosphocholine cytidylyltransferase family protein [Proteobacteria bacterium]|nr:MAG: phosphocholine cytidylyltransferase family protein [Pseudomonadota bacterium]
MRAIILAAGVGRRLEGHGDRPKCLLEFGGHSLLERHVRILKNLGVTDLTLCVGYRHELIDAVLGNQAYAGVTTVVNEAYHEGSIVSLWATREVLRSGNNIMLMDADVLYSEGTIRPLVDPVPRNRFLCDRNFEPGDEPVKICLRAGRIVEFRKRLAPDLDYNDCGESIGFFSFTAEMAARLADLTDSFVSSGRREEPYEEAIRELALAHPTDFCVEDVTGLPWIEIDYPEDIVRANEIIMPQLDDY